MAGLTTTLDQRVRELEAQLTAMAYERERLEQAVLKAWEHSGIDADECGVCARTQLQSSPVMRHRLPIEHAEDCLVPALIAKHEGVRVTPNDPADADHAADLERVLQTYVDHITDETP